LEILYTHVGGIDVHKKQITVTARTPDPKRVGTRWQTTRTFRTFYGDLLAMASWLVHERGVTHVAMESTGPYWWPVYAALREVGGPGLTIEVVNAAHVKAVPGRKTDLLTEPPSITAAQKLDRHFASGPLRRFLALAVVNRSIDLEPAMTEAGHSVRYHPPASPRCRSSTSTTDQADTAADLLTRPPERALCRSSEKMSKTPSGWPS
jgi:hypothetical protein